jgi:aminoglycoside/choline kinase family phosphotransferase
MRLDNNGSLKETVKAELKKFSSNAELVSVSPLSGDASNRSYFRLILKGFKKKSAILMKLNQIDRGIMSEEIVNLQKKFTEIPFLNIQRFLYDIKVRVPEVYYYSADNNMIFIEDFGNQVMYDVLKRDNADRAKLYRMAIDQLTDMQFGGIKKKNNDCYAFWHRFDEKLFMWEFSHFIEYAIEKREKTKQEDLKEIERFFRNITEMITGEIDVFTHRDYHSKNLMVMEDELGILDFQDALIGPPQYDLASLLRDSYTELEDGFVYECVEHYVKRVKERYGLKFGLEKFTEKFDLMSIQRNLKAVGRFHYIAIVKKNPNYLQFIPGTLKKVKRNLLKYSWLKPLYDILSQYVKELR